MNTGAVHYDLIKENNKKLIRNLVREHRSTTKTELVEYSGLTFPTVTAALNDLLKEGEILSLAGSSSGGRPGAVFELNPEFAAVLCASLREFELTLNVYDYCGELLEGRVEKINAACDENKFMKFFQSTKEKFPKIEVVVLGIPGVAVNGVVCYLPYLQMLENKNLKVLYEEKLQVHFFLENDINMIAMGEVGRGRNFAHLLWNQGCIGSAIVLEGKLLRGNHGSAGELEYICDEKAGKRICIRQALLSISCVVDVPLIAVSGDGVTQKDVSEWKEWLSEKLLPFRMPAVVYVPDEKNLYERGLWEVAMEDYRRIESYENKR